MPQNSPNGVIEPVNSSPLQAQITLGTSGNMILVGNPGGPVIFAKYGSPIVPAISTGIPRSLVR